MVHSDSDDDDECPLCMEPLDIADKNFYPCTCGYQVCLLFAFAFLVVSILCLSVLVLLDWRPITVMDPRLDKQRRFVQFFEVEFLRSDAVRAGKTIRICTARALSMSRGHDTVMCTCARMSGHGT